MAKSKQQEIEKHADAILTGVKSALEMSVPTQGERAGRRRDLTLFELNMDRIRPDPDQVRRANKAADDPEIKELAASIKDKGILQPLDVRYVSRGDYYEIIAGERRFTAAKMSGLTAVPVKLIDASDKEARMIQLIENIHRADLLPTELGAALQVLLKDGQSVGDLARLLRKSKPYIQKALGIAEHLDPKIQAEARQAPERLQSMEHLYQLSKLPWEKQTQLWKQIKEQGLNVREVRKVTEEVKRTEVQARGHRRGRPAGIKPYAKTFTTKVGAQVTVRFRKSRATQDEVKRALQEALAS